MPRDDLIGRPQPRGVGGAHLVAQGEHAVHVAELELGVGQNEADVGRPRRRPGVELQADVARRRGGLRADQVDRLGEVDVDVVPLGRLGRRGEDRLGQAVGQLETGRHRRPVHGPRLLVLLVGLPGQVAAHDAFERQHVGPSHQDGPAGPLGREPGVAEGALDLPGVLGQEGAGDDVGHLRGPKDGHGREHPSLVGDRLGHDHVEGAHPVRGHYQQAVVPGVVELADFAREHLGKFDGHESESESAMVGLHHSVMVTAARPGRRRSGRRGAGCG